MKALHVRRPRREQLAFALGLLLGVISWRCSERNEILRLVVMLAALRGEPPRRGIKFYFGAMLAGCAALSLLSAAGIFGQLYLVQDFDGSGPDLRWCFGMGNPNAASCMFAMLILTGLWLFGEKLRWYSYLLLLGADLLLYVLCRSALSFGVLLLGLLLSALFRYSARAGKSDLLYRSAGILLAAGLLFCAAGAVWGDSLPFVGWIDTHLLTGRVASLWDTTFRAGTLATWRWFGDRRNTVFFDLGWVRVIYWYGVIPMLAALALVYRWLQVVRERRDTAAFALVCPLVLYTLAEAHLVSVYLGRNIALPLLAACLPYILGAGQGSEQ